MTAAGRSLIQLDRQQSEAIPDQRLGILLTRRIGDHTGSERR